MFTQIESETAWSKIGGRIVVIENASDQEYGQGGRPALPAWAIQELATDVPDGALHRYLVLCGTVKVQVPAVAGLEVDNLSVRLVAHIAADGASPPIVCPLRMVSSSASGGGGAHGRVIVSRWVLAHPIDFQIGYYTYTLEAYVRARVRHHGVERPVELHETSGEQRSELRRPHELTCFCEHLDWRRAKWWSFGLVGPSIASTMRLDEANHIDLINFGEQPYVVAIERRGLGASASTITWLSDSFTIVPDFDEMTLSPGQAVRLSVDTGPGPARGIILLRVGPKSGGVPQTPIIIPIVRGKASASTDDLFVFESMYPPTSEPAASSCLPLADYAYESQIGSVRLVNRRSAPVVIRAVRCLDLDVDEWTRKELRLVTPAVTNSPPLEADRVLKAGEDLLVRLGLPAVGDVWALLAISIAPGDVPGRDMILLVIHVASML